MDLSQWEWTCACCGQRKRGVPDQAFDAPIHHHWAAGDDPDFQVLEKTDDDCVMEIAGDRAYFIRGVLEVPIHGTDQRLGFGVWSTLSEQNYHRYADSFFDDDQSKLGPMFGYLANRLPAYPDTLNLKLDVLPQDNRQRPLLRLWDEAAEHPLYRDQSFGVDTGRLTELLSRIMPCEGSA
jgi:hypothetical protein